MRAQILTAGANPLGRLEPCVTLGVCLAGARPSPPPSGRQSLCRFRNPCGSLRVRANAQKRSSTLRFRLPSSPFVSESRYGDFCEAGSLPPLSYLLELCRPRVSRRAETATPRRCRRSTANGHRCPRPWHFVPRVTSSDFRASAYSRSQTRLFMLLLIPDLSGQNPLAPHPARKTQQGTAPRRAPRPTRVACTWPTRRNNLPVRVGWTGASLCAQRLRVQRVAHRNPAPAARQVARPWTARWATFEEVIDHSRPLGRSQLSAD